MPDNLHLKLFLSHSVDLNELWRQVCLYTGVHLGGESGYYTVVYDGPKAEGLEILKLCLKACDSGKFYADFGA